MARVMMDRLVRCGLLVAFFVVMTGCTEQLYTNPLVPNFGIMGEVMAGRPPSPQAVPPRFSEAVEKLIGDNFGLYAGYNREGVDVLDRLYRKAGNSLKINDLINASRQEQGWCSHLPVNRSVLICSFHARYWGYLTREPSPGRTRYISGRGLFVTHIYLQYPENNVNAPPISGWVTSERLEVGANTQQYEIGIPQTASKGD